MQNQLDRSARNDRKDESAAISDTVGDIGAQTRGLDDATVSSADEAQVSFDESHRGFDEAHKQVREMQKSAAQNWEHDAG